MGNPYLLLSCPSLGHSNYQQNGFRRHPRGRGNFWTIPKVGRVLCAATCRNTLWIPCVRTTLHGSGDRALVPSA